jgi:YgiT-type zinc finger domain-containing protein
MPPDLSEQKCLYCQGHLIPQTVTRIQEYQGRWIVIENLPTLVCSQCGEVFYTPQAHDLVVRLITGQDAPVRTETVPVYDAALGL